MSRGVLMLSCILLVALVGPVTNVTRSESVACAQSKLEVGSPLPDWQYPNSRKWSSVASGNANGEGENWAATYFTEGPFETVLKYYLTKLNVNNPGSFGCGGDALYQIDRWKGHYASTLMTRIDKHAVTIQITPSEDAKETRITLFAAAR